jgi:membrane fusion protein, multidrug efflux system
MRALYIIVFALSMAACSRGEATLEEKREELEKQRRVMENAQARINELEREIAVLDPGAVAAPSRNVLVTVQELEPRTFSNYLEVRGIVESRRNITISAENPGVVQRIAVREGDEVRRGQVLLQQDNEVMQRNRAELQTSLDLATTVYERQARLWEQNIGTEVQYLQAKNNKESIEQRLRSLQAQIDRTSPRAPFNGVVDQVMIREGENAMPGTPMVRIVGLEDMYVQADVSEVYMERIRSGDSALVQIPSMNLERRAVIRAVSRVINPQNRTFSVEIALPGASQLRPKMLAVVQIQDFVKENAIVVPSNIIQQDRRSNYIFVAQPSGNRHLARRVNIERGPTFRNQTLVTSGLQGNELLIRDGFREVADSVAVQIVQDTLR